MKNMMKLTKNDEFGNADNICVYSGDLKLNSGFENINKVIAALNNMRGANAIEIAEKHEAAVRELKIKAGDKADELLAVAEKLSVSSKMMLTEAIYFIIQEMIDKENTFALQPLSEVYHEPAGENI